MIQLNILLVNRLQFGWYLCMDKPPRRDTEYKLFDYQLSRIPGDKEKDKDIIRLDFRRLPDPVFDPPRKETAGRVTR